jgi:predicted outer membrane repeat protein
MLELLESRLTPTTFNVPSQFPTISSALNAANNGDTILLDPAQGPYSSQGDLNLSISKVVTLDSSTPGVNAIISCGGAIFARITVSGTTIDNLTVENSPAAIFVNDSTVNVANAFNGCDFETNPGLESDGGAVTVSRGISTFSHCTFNKNSGNGAVEFTDSSGSFDHCVFTNNTGNGGPGGIEGLASSLTLSNCTFADNQASNTFGAAAVLWQDGPVTITQCSFTNNSAPNGGGALYVAALGSATNLTIARSAFVNNSAHFGGAIEAVAVSHTVGVTVTDCLFTGNSATDGAVLNLQASEGDSVSTNIINSSFFGNVTSGSDQTGAISAFTTTGGTAPLTISNSILFGDLTPFELSAAHPPSSVNIDHSDITRGFAGTSNINADPLYSSPPTGDFHLQNASPAIGTGTTIGAPTTDLNGVPWGNPNGNPNMGAFAAVPGVAKFVISTPANGNRRYTI